MEQRGRSTLAPIASVSLRSKTRTHLDAAMAQAFSFARQLAENPHLSVLAEIVRIAEHPLDAVVACLSLGNRAPLEM
jgi:uncharacterized protein YciW